MLKKIMQKSSAAGAIMLLAAVVTAMSVGQYKKSNVTAKTTHTGNEIVLSEPVYRNDTKQSCYVRLKVVNPTYTDTASKTSYNLFVFYTGGKEGIHESDWMYSDGYYYYKKAVDKGSSTSPLYDMLTTNPKINTDSNYAQTIIIAQTSPSSKAKNATEAFKDFGET